MGASNDGIPELVGPQEGFSTLSAQAVRQSVERIRRVIRQERERGTSEEALQKALRRDLPEFDGHTRGLIFRLATEENVPDDFSREDIVEREQPKPGSVILTLKKDPEGPELHSLVRYLGKEWLVLRREGKRWTLRALDA
jgi:hypothetical protein